MAPALVAAIEMRITGRVQGVGFRYALRETATAAGLRGWVRNRRDGSVEALAIGPREALERLEAWARRGPPGARVDGLSVARIDPPGDAPADGFVLRPTV